MSLSHHHQNQLHLTQGRPPPVRPQLAARLSMFGRLSAGQAMPAREQVSSRHDRIRQAAALIAETISVVAAAIFLFLRASSSSGRSSPWPPPSRRAAAPGRPRKGANGHGPGRGAGGRPDRRPGLTADTKEKVTWVPPRTRSLTSARSSRSWTWCSAAGLRTCCGPWPPRAGCGSANCTRKLPAVTPRVLTERLRKLERDGSCAAALEHRGPCRDPERHRHCPGL